jgi:translocation and assembly module TamA
VAVREAPFRTIRVGPGIGVSAVRWDMHAVAGWTDRNWLGDLRRLTLQAVAGYAWVPNFWKPSRQSPVGLVSADFAQPDAIHENVDATTTLTLERGLEEGYDFYSERGRLGFPLRFTPRVSLVPSYNLEVYQLFNTGGVLIPGTIPGTTTAGPTLQACKNNICLLSYLEQRITWDRRDDPVNTRRGVWLSLALQEGFNLGSYGYRYVRFLPEARGFLPLGNKVLAVRFRAGGLIPVNETTDPPIVARFTAGGPLSMRGYYARRLSPMILQGTNWVPVGGNGVVDGSLELRFDVSRNLGGAVFLDGGYVSPPSSVPSAYRTAFNPKNTQYALGFGLRYRTPFGPLRADVAARLPTNFAAGVPFSQRFPPVPSVVNAGVVTDAQGNVVAVIPSEHREPIIAVHLTLGEAF